MSIKSIFRLMTRGKHTPMPMSVFFVLLAYATEVIRERCFQIMCFNQCGISGETCTLLLGWKVVKNGFEP
jgi:hypothetical protein